MITRIALKNWKSHLDSEFEFTSGVNALMGIMGSGKSSVMQAISFALFGTFPSHQTKKVSLDDLIMTKPQKKKKAEIELEFSIDDDNYYIRRVLEYGKGTTHAEIRKNKQLLDVNPQGVTKEVERILQIDYELFSKAVYSEQDGIDYFLRIPKGQRMVQIDRMIKLDRFEKARERSVSLKNKIIERRKEKMRFLMEMKKEDFTEKITNVKEELQELKKQSSSLKKELEGAAQEREKLTQKVGSFEDREFKLNELKVGFGSVSASIREIEDQIQEKRSRIKDKSVSQLMNDFEKLKAETAHLESGIEGKNETEKKFRDKISESNTKIMILTKDEIPKLEAKINEMENDWIRFRGLAKKFGSEPEKELEEKSRELEGFKKHIYNLEARKMELLKNLDQLKSADVKCPVCDSHIDSQRKEELVSQRVKAVESLDKELESNREKTKKLEELVSEIEKTAKEITILKERLKDYDSLKKELENSKRRSENLRKDVNQAATFLEKLKDDISKTKEQLKARETQRENLRSITDDMKNMGELQKKLNDYLENRKSLEKEVREMENELKLVNIKELRSLLQKTVAKESGMNANLASVEEKLEDRKNTLEDLKKRREVLEKYRKDVLKDEMISLQMETFVKVLKLTQEQLREEFLKNVNAIMNRIWDELYPYGDFSEIKLMVEEGDYVLKLRGSEGWVSVDGVASGGERSMSVLALRVAFSLAFIPNLRWIILDEPTHNLDTNAIQHFSNVLREKMDKFAEQIFLITHEEGIANGITGQLYMLERDKATDEATRIKVNEE